MIELRWMAQNIYGDGKVLQYRQRLVKGAWASEPPANAPTEWSEWRDVPTAFPIPTVAPFGTVPKNVQS